MSTPIENWLAQFEGTLQGIVLACTSMISMHSEKEKIIVLLTALSSHAAENSSDDEKIKNYKKGIRESVATMIKGVETAQLADQIKNLKSTTGSH